MSCLLEPPSDKNEQERTATGHQSHQTSKTATARARSKAGHAEETVPETTTVVDGVAVMMVTLPPPPVPRGGILLLGMVVVVVVVFIDGVAALVMLSDGDADG